MLGDGAVGKTSLVRRFVVDKFSDNYITTVGAKVTKKDLRISIGVEVFDVTLVIWDVLGQRGFHWVQESVFGGARGVIMVFDLTRPETEEGVRTYWAKRLREAASDIAIVVFGNKLDLVSNLSHAKEEAERLALEIGCEYFLTSAKTGENVELGFETLARKLVLKREVIVTSAVARPTALVGGDIVSVADMIMVDFCNDFGGIEAATPLLREQFDRAGLNLSKPSMNSLLKAIDLLAGVEKSFKSSEEVERSRIKRLDWVRNLGKS